MLILIPLTTLLQIYKYEFMINSKDITSISSPDDYFQGNQEAWMG